jgi:hypothetical protein
MKSKVFVLGSLILVFMSCNRQPSICKIVTDGYKVDTIAINPTKFSEVLDTTQYIISEIFSLETTKETHVYNPSIIKRINNRIYVMTDDQNGNHTIYAYNDEGRFLHVLGKHGRARNEYIDSPTFFSFNYKNGDIHVYERSSNRILVFNKDGHFLYDAKFRDGFPNSACVTESGNYICAYDEGQNDAYDRLAICDNLGNRLKSLLPIGKNESFGMMASHLDYNLSYCYFHYPFADVVTVVYNNEIKKFYKLDFGGAFIPKDLMEEAIEKKSFMPVFDKHHGVQGIERFEASNDLIHVVYPYNDWLYHYLYNKKTKQHYNNKGSFFMGIWPTFNYWIHEDQIIYLITKDDVDNIKKTINTEHGDGKRWYYFTHSKMRDVIDGKIKTPVFVSVQIK